MPPLRYSKIGCQTIHISMIYVPIVKDVGQVFPYLFFQGGILLWPLGSTESFRLLPEPRCMPSSYHNAGCFGPPPKKRDGAIQPFHQSAPAALMRQSHLTAISQAAFSLACHNRPWEFLRNANKLLSTLCHHAHSKKLRKLSKGLWPYLFLCKTRLLGLCCRISTLSFHKCMGTWALFTLVATSVDPYHSGSSWLGQVTVGEKGSGEPPMSLGTGVAWCGAKIPSISLSNHLRVDPRKGSIL